MRAAFAVLCSCVLLSLSAAISPVQAGDYYDRYQPRRSSNVWYSSDCCYKKVVRHVRQVRYVRTDPYRRHSYYEPPRYRHTYYAPPRNYHYSRPTRYPTVYVEPRPRYTTYAPHYTSYRGYDAYNAVSRDCYSRRVPVLDGRGGWVWGYRQGCY